MGHEAEPRARKGNRPLTGSSRGGVAAQGPLTRSMRAVGGAPYGATKRVRGGLGALLGLSGCVWEAPWCRLGQCFA
eukprot:1813708-Pyramimonas_sp.AAC.1